MSNNSKGVVVFARNNGKLDYVKQAVYLAKRVKKYLNLPISIITDSENYLRDNFDIDVFDKVINVSFTDSDNNRAYFDGSLSHKTAPFKNDMRDEIYILSPYDETLLLDTDYILCNSLLLNCFDAQNDLMMFKDSYDLSFYRDTTEFQYISDYSIDFYWATVVFFRKTPNTRVFFDLIRHIKEEWNHYRRIYQIGSTLFRNDFAFSIAVHIMNGFSKGDLVTCLPGKHYYTTDRDILQSLDNERMIFLIEKKDYLGEYTLLKTENQSVHVMNKFSLERIIDKELSNG
jgi:hypothetical protein